MPKANTPSADSKEEPPERDFWSKLQILLTPIGGLLTALSVALLGLYGSSFFNKKQELDTRARIYAELMSQREQADSALRKDMFVSIIDAFLKPEKISYDVKVLNMELLTYNFHESLNLKPLFAYLQRQVEALEDKKVKEELMARLVKVAGDVTRKQMLVLGEVGAKFDSTIDLETVRRYQKDPEHVELPPAHETILNLAGIDRTFELWPLKVNDINHDLQLRLVIKTKPQHSSKVDTLYSSVEYYEFSVGYYDFPMIDNTRLDHDQRCAVVLNKFVQEQDQAEITLIYFPGSRASLKEKPFYEDVIANLQMTPAPEVTK
jgi:hypothetical protein